MKLVGIRGDRGFAFALVVPAIDWVRRGAADFA